MEGVRYRPVQLFSVLELTIPNVDLPEFVQILINEVDESQGRFQWSKSLVDYLIYLLTHQAATIVLSCPGFSRNPLKDSMNDCFSRYIQRVFVFGKRHRRLYKCHKTMKNRIAYKAATVVMKKLWHMLYIRGKEHEVLKVRPKL